MHLEGDRQQIPGGDARCDHWASAAAIVQGRLSGGGCVDGDLPNPLAHRFTLHIMYLYIYIYITYVYIIPFPY